MRPLSTLDRFNPFTVALAPLLKASFSLPSATSAAGSSTPQPSDSCPSVRDHSAQPNHLAIPFQYLQTDLATLIRTHAVPTAARQGIGLATLVAMALNTPSTALAADVLLESPDVPSPIASDKEVAQPAHSPNQRWPIFRAPEVKQSVTAPNLAELDLLAQGIQELEDQANQIPESAFAVRARIAQEIAGVRRSLEQARDSYNTYATSNDASASEKDVARRLYFAKTQTIHSGTKSTLNQIHDFLKANAEIDAHAAEAESLEPSTFAGHPEVEAEALRIKSDAKSAVTALRSELFGDQGMLRPQAEFRSAMWCFSRLEAKFQDHKNISAKLLARAEAIQKQSEGVRYPAYQEQINACALASRISELQATIGTKEFQGAKRRAQHAINRAENAYENYLYIENKLETIQAKASTEGIRNHNKLFTANPEFSSTAYAKMAEEPLRLAHDLNVNAKMELRAGKRLDATSQNRIFAALKRSDDMVEQFKAGVHDLKHSRTAVAPLAEAIEEAVLPSKLHDALSGLLASYHQTYASTKSAFLSAQPVDTAATLRDASALQKTVAFYLGAAERIHQATQQLEALKGSFDSLTTDTGQNELQALSQDIDSASSLISLPPEDLLASPDHRKAIDIALSRLKSQVARTQMALVRKQIQDQWRNVLGANPGSERARSNESAA